MRSLNLHYLLVALVCAAPLSASAQSGAPTSASALTAENAFLEGVRLMKQGDCQQAVQRFEESQGLDPASGTLLNLAYCQTQLGKTASAWLAYRRAIALAERTGKPAHAQLAREQGEKLEGTLPKLRFVLVGDASRIKQLKLDDEEMVKESWSLAVPVEPGQHRVLAVFDSGKTWETRFLAQPAQQSLVEVMVPQAEVDSAAHGPTRPPVASRASTTPAAPATSAPNRPSSWALGLGLTGASAVVAGTALFVSARLGYDAARDHCSAANVCRSPYDDRERSAQSRATLSFIVGGSGLLLVGAAAVLHLQAGPDDKSRAQLNAAVVGPRDFRAAYTRAF